MQSRHLFQYRTPCGKIVGSTRQEEAESMLRLHKATCTVCLTRK